MSPPRPISTRQSSPTIWGLFRWALQAQASPALSLSCITATSCRSEEAAKAKEVLHPMHNRVPTRFIPRGQAQPVFRIAKTAENSQIWDLLTKEQDRWEIEFCYCSVFQECWQVPGKRREPKRVSRCERDEAREILPLRSLCLRCLTLRSSNDVGFNSGFP
jgi:hypothetical protein